MDSKDIKIKDELRRITHTGDDTRMPVMTGVVKGVDVDNMSCEVELTCNDTGSNGVVLNVVTSNVTGMYLLPAVGSDCIVAEVDGPGKWELLKASAYTKACVTIGANSFTMTADGVTVDANVITIKSPDTSIGGGDAFANHVAQYEGVLSVANWLAARVTTIEQRWNQFKLLYAPGSGGSPAAIPAIAIPRGPSFDVMKVEKVKTD